MRKHIALLLAAILIIALAAGCTNSNTDSVLSGDKNVNGTAPESTQQNLSSTGGVIPVNDPEAAGEAVSLSGSITTIALSDSININGKGATAKDGVVTIIAAGNYSVSGTLTDGQIVVKSDGAEVNLELAGADITNDSGPAVYIADAKMTNIILKEGSVNNLADGSSYSNTELKAALFSEDSLTIKGNGALNVTGKYKHGIACDDKLNIEGGNITVKSAVTDGIHANEDITINKGNFAVNADSDGIESEMKVTVNAGVLNVTAGDDGIHAETELGINNGSINVTASYEGIEGKSKITIGGGNIRLKSDDDAVNAGTDITVNGGYIYADCSGDGLDSNGNMTINGGTVIVFAGNNANGPLDSGDRNGTFTINGGTVMAAGGNMGIAVSDSSKQYSMWIASQVPENTLVNISAQNGTELATLSLIKSASLIFYSSDKVTANTAYDIKTGGSHSGKAVDGIYSGGSYSGGTTLGSITMSAKNISLGNAGGGMGGWMDGGPGEGGRRNGGFAPGEGGKNGIVPDGQGGRDDFVPGGGDMQKPQ